jgi:DNA-binding NarL/FixJ family response regulator
MNSVDIEKIFQEEYVSFTRNVSVLESLVTEVKDVAHSYDSLKQSFAQIVKSNSYNAESLKDLLEKHLSIIVRLTDINKQIADILYPSQPTVSE